jgi:hypothetical protein
MSAPYPTPESRAAARKETYKKHGKKRRQDPEYREAQKSRYKAWALKNPLDAEQKARKAEQMRGYRGDPELRLRHIARWLVNRRIKSGKLIKQPCEVCSNPEAHGHHDDYSKPLDVRWLCRTHHDEHHTKATGGE